MMLQAVFSQDSDPRTRIWDQGPRVESVTCGMAHFGHASFIRNNGHFSVWRERYFDTGAASNGSQARCIVA